MRSSLILEGSRRALFSNHLVVIEPALRGSLFPSPFDPAQLLDERLELLSLANPDSVPAGRYARACLEARGWWEVLAPRVVPAVDLRAALAAVESGAARAGIVYASEAALSSRVRLLYRVLEEEAPPIAYPVAAMGGRPRAGAARAFITWLEGPQARAAFERFGLRSFCG